MCKRCARNSGYFRQQNLRTEAVPISLAVLPSPRLSDSDSTLPTRPPKAQRVTYRASRNQWPMKELLSFTPTLIYIVRTFWWEIYHISLRQNILSWDKYDKNVYEARTSLNLIIVFIFTWFLWGPYLQSNMLHCNSISLRWNTVNVYSTSLKYINILPSRKKKPTVYHNHFKRRQANSCSVVSYQQWQQLHLAKGILFYVNRMHFPFYC